MAPRTKKITFMHTEEVVAHRSGSIVPVLDLYLGKSSSNVNVQLYGARSLSKWYDALGHASYAKIVQAAKPSPSVFPPNCRRAHLPTPYGGGRRPGFKAS